MRTGKLWNRKSALGRADVVMFQPDQEELCKCIHSPAQSESITLSYRILFSLDVQSFFPGKCDNALLTILPKNR